LEINDEAHPSTQIHGWNQRKTTQIARSKSGKKSPKIAKIKNIAASLSLLSSPLLHHEAHPYFSKNNYG
jgi:hypothetical protein